MVHRFVCEFCVLLLFSLSVSALNLTSQQPLNYSNPRATQNWDTFAIVGDAGIRNSTTELLRKTLGTQKINKLIMPGDNLYLPTSTYSSVWDVWKKDGFLFSIVAIGNHNRGYANETAYFNMPGEYYAIESKGALFIVLNSDNEKNVSEQMAWAGKVLSESQYPLNFLVYHHPTITVSNTHEWQERKKFQLGVRQLLKNYSSTITSIFVGHDHSAGIYTLDGLPMVLSGASWESRKIALPIKKDEQINGIGLWATTAGGFWWTRLDYNALTKEAYVHFNRFDRPAEVCTFRIAPKPIAKSQNCN